MPSFAAANDTAIVGIDVADHEDKIRRVREQHGLHPLEDFGGLRRV
jgi:hypothetical protein